MRAGAERTLCERVWCGEEPLVTGPLLKGLCLVRGGGWGEGPPATSVDRGMLSDNTIGINSLFLSEI